VPRGTVLSVAKVSSAPTDRHIPDKDVWYRRRNT